MAKTDGSSKSTNRDTKSIANSVSKDPVSGPPTIAVDIALTGASFTRSSVQTDLDDAITVAIALAASSGKPTRVTLNGVEYQVFSRSQGQPNGV